ncbi:acetyl-CoA carboxylase biotin carboxylase subunit family protein [Amycolatopsis sp. NPDC052450]|uniref:acetyl-CoA carboxylase biotin carboxylase subunit family protein n=1 Tax=Amycolatopsis sp. NPDC052450 TaxID=3363937 RepID=UPI0037C8E1D5
MNVLVLGREEDSLDYLRHCGDRETDVTFFEPPALPPGERARWQDKLTSLVTEKGDLAGFDDIVSFRDGYQVHTDLLRVARGLPARDIDALNCLTDKSLFKAHPALRGHIARHIELPLSTSVPDALAETLRSLRFPVVLKPSNGFYSAGVVRVDREEDFRKAFVSVKRVCGLLLESRGPSQVIVEEYLDGDEIMADGFVVDGEVVPLLFHRKLPKLTGLPTFHETGCVSEPFDRAKGTEITALLEHVVRGVGLDNSPFNAEFRYDADGGLHVLEIAPRLSGGGASVRNLLRICTGLDAYDIHRKLGREHVDLEPVHSRAGLEYDFCAAKNGYLTNVDDVVARCAEYGAETILRYRENGQFVFAPPLNVETVLTAYFPCESAADAERLLERVQRDCVIETVPERT